MRPLSYTKSDVILICFSIDSPTSLSSVANKWVPEARQYAPTTPYILVGTKLDRRAELGPSDTVSSQEGQAMAHDIKAVAYMECSALTQEGLKEVFDLAVRTTLGKLQQDDNCCVIL